MKTRIPSRALGLGAVMAALAPAARADLSAGTTAQAAAPAVTPVPYTQAQIDSILRTARLTGSEAHPELIIDIPLEPALAARGITGAQRVYKGICGPDGAVATPEDLLAHARRDLEMHGQTNRAVVTETIGQSPALAITYDNADIVNTFLYVPMYREAAAYIDSRLNNRVTVRADISSSANFSGNVIGSAGSTLFAVGVPEYVEGLRSSSIRTNDSAAFANLLPSSTLPVTYFPSTVNEDRVLITSAQLKAIFGDNALGTNSDVSITINNQRPWDITGCAVDPASNQPSLIDVVVHEITHSLGFRSQIEPINPANPSSVLNNPGDDIAGLDVARFTQANLFNALVNFGTTPRFGELTSGQINFYVSPPSGFSTLLEDGDTNQPSHLAFFSDFDDKLGVMDPVIPSGRTRCPELYTQADLQPLDDMGWTRRAVTSFFADCNLNGIFDGFELSPSTDVDDDAILDACESWSPGSSRPANNTDGVTVDVYSTPGLTSLANFNPNGPGVTRTSSIAAPNFNQIITLSAAAPRVIVLSTRMQVPTRDEYAFRLDHPNDMTVTIDGQTILASNTSGVISIAPTDPTAEQAFIQLEPGFHTVTVSLFTTASSVPTNLVRDSRSLGGWQNIPNSDLETLGFSDCNLNTINDALEPDCDSDGIADDCETDANNNNVPDDCELDCDLNSFPDVSDRALVDVASATNLGTIGTPLAPININTLGSNFDTELALWQVSSGVLLASNDDLAPGNLQSQIVVGLQPGQYIFAVTGFNASFSNIEPGDSGIDFTNCSAAGVAAVSVNGIPQSPSNIFSGRARYFTFTIGEDCDADGTFDQDELDCDADGFPDDCQRPSNVDFVGVIGNDSAPIVINTRGSNYDTEIAVWDGTSGLLIAQNDDAEPGFVLQSELILDLPAGDYVLGLGGFNMLFDPNLFAVPSPVIINASGFCSAGGDLVVNLGDLSDGATVPPGRAFLLGFTVEPSPACSPADLTLDGQVDSGDLSLFITAFLNQDAAIADLTDDGQVDSGDLSLFISLFLAGCP